MSVQCRGELQHRFAVVIVVVVIAVVVADVDSEASNAVFSGDAAPRRSKSKEISSLLLSELSFVPYIHACTYGASIRMYNGEDVARHGSRRVSLKRRQ